MEEGEKLAGKYQMRFMEVSAKSGFNVQQGFEMLVEEIHKKQEGKSETKNVKEVKLDSKGGEARKKCEC